MKLPAHCGFPRRLTRLLVVFVPLLAVAAPTVVEEIAALRREIARHDALYHREAAPEISDAEYDALKRKLRALEAADPEAAAAAPPLVEIGDDRTGLFARAAHRAPMLSLEKAYTDEELKAFVTRVTRTLGGGQSRFVIEPKLDGLAISLTFEEGRLIRAVTRGNGREGDDVTAPVRRIAGGREQLAGAASTFPRMVELRGEIYLPLAEFQRLNEERELAGATPFANARAAAAGSLRQLDPEAAARRGLALAIFGIGACEPVESRPVSQTALIAQVSAWGLPALPERTTAVDAKSVVSAVRAMGEARAGWPFPADGVVVKVDAYSRQEILGTGEAAPRWAIAFKFAAERVETRVRAITVQIGRTGVLTPVAELEPVRVGGSVVARATLHNRHELARKDVRAGDWVVLEKAGDIIPAIVGVLPDRRPPGTTAFVFPRACPACDTAVLEAADAVAVRCPNGKCGAQVRRRIEHYASSGAVAIAGLGPALIEALVAAGKLQDVPDVYRLTRDDLRRHGGLGVATAQRVAAAIERSKRAELWRVIYGLGLPEVGAVTARSLAQQHLTLAALADAFPAQAPAIRALMAAGVESVVAGSPGERPLTGKVFVLTGTLPSLTRQQATSMIERAGGRVSSSLGRDTHYLVAGRDPGGKLEDGKRRGVTILDEAGLRALCSGF